jgi:hypothetical protein
VQAGAGGASMEVMLVSWEDDVVEDEIAFERMLLLLVSSFCFCFFLSHSLSPTTHTSHLYNLLTQFWFCLEISM